MPVGAEKAVTSCDLQVFVWEAAEAVSSQWPDGCAGPGECDRRAGAGVGIGGDGPRARPARHRPRGRRWPWPSRGAVARSGQQFHALADVMSLLGVVPMSSPMTAYIEGLEQAAANGQTLAGIASVATFFVSRVDTEIDKRLEKIGTDEALALRGKAGVVNSRLAYAAFQKVFQGTPERRSPHRARSRRRHGEHDAGEDPAGFRRSRRGPGRQGHRTAARAQKVFDAFERVGIETPGWSPSRRQLPGVIRESQQRGCRGRGRWRVCRPGRAGWRRSRCR
jgi:hypothetical protein